MEFSTNKEPCLNNHRKNVAQKNTLNKGKRTYKQLLTKVFPVNQTQNQYPTNTRRLVQRFRYYIYKLVKGFGVEKVSLVLLTMLFITLPWNLGKHIQTEQSYYNQKLISYLMPTIYVQDVLVAAFVILQGLACLRKIRFSNVPFVKPFLILTILVFFALFFSERSYPALYLFSRIFLYFIFFVFAFSFFQQVLVRKSFVYILLANSLLLCVLGFLQFQKQASVFTNYLFFGEQPYTYFTSGVARESYFGATKIPPYGTFQHPNVLAGFVSVAALFVAFLLSKAVARVLKLFYSLTFAALFILMVLAKSYVAIFSLLFVLVGFLVIRRVITTRTRAALLLVTFTVVLLSGFLFSLYTPYLSFYKNIRAESPSFSRRATLLDASYKMIAEKPLFGWGLNSFTYSSEPYFQTKTDAFFIQPTHSVYVLAGVETGLLSVLVFIFILFGIVYRLAKLDTFLPLLIIHFSFLFSFDHYFYTYGPAFLLFILTLLFCLAYTKKESAYDY